VTYPVTEDVHSVIPAVMASRDGTVIASLGGDLDIAAVPAVRERLLGLLRPGAVRLVVDMSAVRYADASGLEALVNTRRRAVLLGGTLRLAALSPEVARVLTAAGLSRRLVTYPTVQAAVADRTPGSRTVPPGTAPAAAAADVRAQAQAGPGTDSGELHAAVSALLASGDAWRDADPRRRFSPALSALARADAGTSHAALIQAARSLLSVLSREPLTYSPAVAATAGRLRRLFAAGPRLAMR
jgi:anti-sigma B factor antagonist